MPFFGDLKGLYFGDMAVGVFGLNVHGLFREWHFIESLMNNVERGIGFARGVANPSPTRRLDR